MGAAPFFTGRVEIRPCCNARTSAWQAAAGHAWCGAVADASSISSLGMSMMDAGPAPPRPAPPHGRAHSAQEERRICLRRSMGDTLFLPGRRAGAARWGGGGSARQVRRGAAPERLNAGLNCYRTCQPPSIAFAAPRAGSHVHQHDVGGDRFLNLFPLSGWEGCFAWLCLALPRNQWVIGLSPGERRKRRENRLQASSTKG